jgi:hypothetical protein
MPVNVTVNGTTYVVPVQGDNFQWGTGQGGTPGVTALLQALSSYSLQKNGGTFTLTNDVDFGSAKGLKGVGHLGLGTNTTTAASGTQALVRSNGNRLEIFEPAGSRWRRVVASDNVYDVREFAPVGVELGQGSAANDTAAMQAALSQLSGTANGVIPSVSAKTGRVFVPAGLNLSINATLQIIGSPSAGILLEGEQGQARGGTNGSCLTWTGAAGGTLIHFRGVNGSLVRNLQFNGGNLADVCFWASEYYWGPATYDGVSQIGSSGLFFENCYFGNPRAATTATPFAVGMDNGVTSQLQASEYRWYNCSFNGNGQGPGLAGCHIRSNGNTKNFTFDRCVFADVDFGVYQPGGSGVTTVRECSFSNIGYNQDGCAVKMGSGNQLRVEDIQLENGNSYNGIDYRARIVSTANQLVCVVSGGYCSGKMPADDYGMVLGGPSVVHGFSFERNTRVGSNVIKLASTSGLDMRSCDFAYNTTAIKNVPVYDGSNNHLVDSDVYRSQVLSAGLTAFGNLSGLQGSTHNTTLPDVQMKRPGVVHGALWVDTADGVDANVSIQDEDGRLRATIPYTAFQTAAPTKTVTLSFTNPAGNVIEKVRSRIVTPFAGTAGTLNLEVGTEDSINEFLLSHSMTAAAGTVKGNANADLGASLASGTRPCPEGKEFTASKRIQVKLTSSSGNLSGLTAGSVVITICYDYTGV